MIVELALVIVMIVIIITEFIKYYLPSLGFSNCPESFSENKLFYYKHNLL